MFKRGILILSLLGLFCGLLFWIVSAPEGLDRAMIQDLEKHGVVKSEKIARGEVLFQTLNCRTCHEDKKAIEEAQATGDAESIQAAKLILSGGKKFKVDYGVLYAPNISPSEQGIGQYTLRDFALAMTKGVSPHRRHLYPIFPYKTYQDMGAEEIAALYFYLKSLPESEMPNRPHEIDFPYDIRRWIGFWKWFN